MATKPPPPPRKPNKGEPPSLEQTKENLDKPDPGEIVSPGTPNFFSTEQVVQIVATKSETPQASEHPVSHGTPTELATEAVKRDIVEKISPRSVGRFLKRSNSTASDARRLANAALS